MALKNIISCGLEPIDQVLQPFQDFFRSKTTGGILLIISALTALIWANSPWGTQYFAVWNTHFTVGYGEYALSKPLILWVNDGLMAIFFFVVGLEIKREFMVGELSTQRQAVLPIFAAIGGMVAPAVIYALINIGGPGTHGWGIPMATDIAFALGILALLGDRIPYQLKIFLTAVAIVDDIGAVLVIAMFYSSGIAMNMLLIAMGLLFIAFIGNRLGIRAPLFYAIIGGLLWLAVLKSGVHSTVAGVLMAFTIPGRTTCDSDAFQFNATAILREYSKAAEPGKSVLTNPTMNSTLLAMQHVAVRAQTPLQRLEHSLHPVADYLIMPVFALGNAGVVLSGNFGALMTNQVALGTMFGLILGKPLGIAISVWILVKTSGGWPGGMNIRQFIGAGLLAGIGFTMSLFIAALAFGDSPEMLNAAKTAILGASALAGLAGYLVLRSEPLPNGE